MILQKPRKYTFSPPNKLTMKFELAIIHEHLELEKTRVNDSFFDEFGIELELNWPKSKMKKVELNSEQEITPELWASVFIQYMEKPDEFEWVSHVLGRMYLGNPELSLGKGKASKYITGECIDLLEVERRNEPVKNSLFVRRRRHV